MLTSIRLMLMMPSSHRTSPIHTAQTDAALSPSVFQLSLRYIAVTIQH